MNSLSENNNIFTSYQHQQQQSNANNKLALSSPLATMTSHQPSATMSIDTKNVNEIWKNNFNIKNTSANNRTRALDLDNTKISWANNNNNNNQLPNKEVEVEVETTKTTSNEQESDCESTISADKNETEKVEVEKDVELDEDVEVENTNDVDVSPAHHARRPMNAFLIFCKKHRPIVRKKFASLENRAVTRILGEWWSILDKEDKKPYTELAKQYKDAFFTANPDFKWYKLPAPPLRTLPTRPAATPPILAGKIEPLVATSTPPISPTNTSIPVSISSSISFGTADESQLGMLSSLLVNYTTPTTKTHDSDSVANQTNLNNCNSNATTPIAQSDRLTLEEPPKPIKKRPTCDGPNIGIEGDNNNKFVRNLFEVKNDEDDLSNGRKSIRKGKGNRYADIMANGKLLKNKRASSDKLTLGNTVNGANAHVNEMNKNEMPDLNETVKRLVERVYPTQSTPNSEDSKVNDTIRPLLRLEHDEDEQQRTRTISEVSEMSDVADYSKAIPSFDLDARIGALTNLSYDTYLQRKKESKKRKTPKNNKMNRENQAGDKFKHGNNNKRPYPYDHTVRALELGIGIEGAAKYVEKQTGSKKRKNKKNITHLENNSLVHSYANANDLSGLTTLAEAAAHQEKIDDANQIKISNNNNNT